MHREGPPPHGDWMEYSESYREVEEIGRIMESIGRDFRESKQTEIGESTIAPDSPCLFRVRYERMPGGEKKLMFEMEWNLSRKYKEQGKDPLSRHLAD